MTHEEDEAFDGDKVKKEEIEKAEKLLNEASDKIVEAAKIFCSILHNKDDCYKECAALNDEGWVICYVYDSLDYIDMMIEK